MAHVQTFRKIENIDRAGFDAIKKKRIEMCKQIGLILQKEGQSLPKEAGLFYPEMEGYELSVWLCFFPTRYSDLADYAYDVIPQEALEDIATAQNLGVFDAIEIWTPEEHKDDPIAVGVTGIGRDRRFFQIVRWGREKLLTFQMVEMSVLTRFYHRGRSDLLWRELPESMVRSISSFFKENGFGDFEDAYEEHINNMIEVKRSRFFDRHCGQQTYFVRIGKSYNARSKFTICGVCGKIIKKSS